MEATPMKNLALSLFLASVLCSPSFAVNGKKTLTVKATTHESQVREDNSTAGGRDSQGSSKFGLGIPKVETNTSTLHAGQSKLPSESRTFNCNYHINAGRSGHFRRCGLCRQDECDSQDFLWETYFCH